MVKKPNSANIEAVHEKLKNGELKVAGSASNSKPKTEEATENAKTTSRKQIQNQRAKLRNLTSEINSDRSVN